jgi:hypothetical protein
MNTNTQSVLRTGLIALSLILASASHASVPDSASRDRAAAKLNLCGSVAVESVGSDVRIGSSRAQVALAIGSPSRVLADGRWIVFRDFWVDQSTAHGSLVVGFTDGKVSELRIVTPNEGAALCCAKSAPASVLLLARR